MGLGQWQSAADGEMLEFVCQYCVGYQEPIASESTYVFPAELIDFESVIKINCLNGKVDKISIRFEFELNEPDLLDSIRIFFPPKCQSAPYGSSASTSTFSHNPSSLSMSAAGRTGPSSYPMRSTITPSSVHSLRYLLQRQHCGGRWRKFGREKVFNGKNKKEKVEQKKKTEKKKKEGKQLPRYCSD